MEKASVTGNCKLTLKVGEHYFSRSYEVTLQCDNTVQGVQEAQATISALAGQQVVADLTADITGTTPRIGALFELLSRA